MRLIQGPNRGGQLQLGRVACPRLSEILLLKGAEPFCLQRLLNAMARASYPFQLQLIPEVHGVRNTNS